MRPVYTEFETESADQELPEDGDRAYHSSQTPLVAISYTKHGNGGYHIGGSPILRSQLTEGAKL